MSKPINTTWVAETETYRETYHLISSYGIMTLERWHGDRGDWRLTLNTQKPIEDIGRFVSNMYFFDLSAAKSEVENWVKLAASQPYFAQENASLKVNIQDIDWETATYQPAQLLPAKICIVSVLQFTDPLQLTIVSPAIPVGIESQFHVDGHDRFPRWYVDPEIARAETIAWLKRRGQFVSDQFLDVAEANSQSKGVWTHLIQ